MPVQITPYDYIVYHTVLCNTAWRVIDYSEGTFVQSKQVLEPRTTIQQLYTVLKIL